MNLNLLSLTLTLLIAAATPALAAKAAKIQWLLADLAQDSGLSSLVGDADAILTVKKTTETSQMVRPLVRIYKDEKLKKPEKEKTASLKELTRLNTPAGKNGKGVILSERAIGSNKYIIEFSTPTEDKNADLHSLYLMMQDGEKHYLFVFDGISTGMGQTLPLVKDLFGKMSPALLKDFFAHAANKTQSSQ